MPAARAPLEVWYDGHCPLCQRSRAWVETRDPGRRVVFCDVHDEALAPVRPRSKEALLREMHVHAGGGRLARGFDGWRLILRALPRWWIVAILCWPYPVRVAGRLAYRIVARNRHRLSIAAPSCNDEACEVARER